MFTLQAKMVQIKFFLFECDLNVGFFSHNSVNRTNQMDRAFSILVWVHTGIWYWSDFKNKVNSQTKNK